MKIKFSVCALALFIIAGMTVPTVQAEHEKMDLNLSNEREQLLQKYLGFADFSATLNNIVYEDKSDEEIIKMMRDTVSSDFKDPDSAKFRNERVFRTKVKPKATETSEDIESDGIYVCGEVNGKNSYGAYVGYRGYWGGMFNVVMDDPGSDTFTYLMLHYCFRK